MAFYTFSIITERDSSLTARYRRLSFKQKMFDLIYILSGSAGLFSLQYNGPLRLTTPHPPIFGLVDYPLFFLKIPRYGLFALYRKGEMLCESDSILAKIVGTVFKVAFPLSLLLIIPNLVATAVLAAVCMPLVAIVHAISKRKGDKLRKALKKNDERNKEIDEVKNDTVISCETVLDPYPLKTQVENYSYQSCKEVSKGLYPANIKAIRLITLTNREVVKAVFFEESIEDGGDGDETWKNSYTLFRNTPEGRTAFNAFIELNVANYEKFIKEHPLLSKDSKIKISQESKNTEQIYNALQVLEKLTPSKNLENKFSEQELAILPLPIELVENIAALACRDELNNDISQPLKIAEIYTQQHGWKRSDDDTQTPIRSDAQPRASL